MKFMHRYRRVLSVLSLLTFLLAGSVTPASAIYNPKTGKFMQRDPNGVGVVLQPSLSYNAANPVITVSMASELQYADGMNFYNYLRSKPGNRTDPSGLRTLPEILTTGAIYAGLSAGLVAGFGAGRGFVQGYGSGLSTRDIVRQMVLSSEKALTSSESIAAILVLSAIAATGPIGLAAAGGIAYGAGMFGVYEASGRIDEAQNHLELALATYDGGASSLVAMMGARAGRGAIIRRTSIVGTRHNALRPTQLSVSAQQVEFYVQRLLVGKVVDPIEVVRIPGRGRFIVDGHHRYIASQLTGVRVPVSETTSVGPAGFPDWSRVTMEP